MHVAFLMIFAASYYYSPRDSASHFPRRYSPTPSRRFVASFHLRSVPLCCLTEDEVGERQHD